MGRKRLPTKALDPKQRKVEEMERTIDIMLEEREVREKELKDIMSEKEREEREKERQYRININMLAEFKKLRSENEKGVECVMKEM